MDFRADDARRDLVKIGQGAVELGELRPQHVIDEALGARTMTVLLQETDGTTIGRASRIGSRPVELRPDGHAPAPLPPPIIRPSEEADAVAIFWG
jgi:hypothetical protein